MAKGERGEGRGEESERSEVIYKDLWGRLGKIKYLVAHYKSIVYTNPISQKGQFFSDMKFNQFYCFFF